MVQIATRPTASFAPRPCSSRAQVLARKHSVFNEANLGSRVFLEARRKHLQTCGKENSSPLRCFGHAWGFSDVLWTKALKNQSVKTCQNGDILYFLLRYHVFYRPLLSIQSPSKILTPMPIPTLSLLHNSSFFHPSIVPRILC